MAKKNKINVIKINKKKSEAEKVSKVIQAKTKKKAEDK